MMVVSILPHAEVEPNEHPENAPLFMIARSKVKKSFKVFFLVMLSIDRYVLIMPPDRLKFLKRARSHPHYVVFTSVTIWIVSFLVAIPTLTNSVYQNNQES